MRGRDILDVCMTNKFLRKFRNSEKNCEIISLTSLKLRGSKFVDNTPPQPYEHPCTRHFREK